MLLSVRVGNDLGERLEKLSQNTHRAKSFYVKEALLNYLDDLEDMYIVEKRLINLRKGDDNILNSRDFWNDLEDWVLSISQKRYTEAWSSGTTTY